MAAEGRGKSLGEAPALAPSAAGGSSGNNLGLGRMGGGETAAPIFTTCSEDGSDRGRIDREIGEDSPRIRWIILFLSCWIMFGNYYAFDNPSALNRPLHGWLAPRGDEESFQYRLSLLYSVYSVPNVILPFFVGQALDRLGSRRILLILSSLVALGQWLVAAGLERRTFPLVLAGRILFGLGGESLAVAQSRLVTHWFEGRELALAIGLNLSIARIGTVVNNVLSPLIGERYSVPAAFWVGFWSCLLSLLCTAATVILDTMYRRETIGILSRESCGGGADEWRGPKRVGGVKDFHWTFWILAVICFLFYGCMIPYNNVASDYLQSRYFGDRPILANLAMSVPDTLAMFLIPALGIFVDYRGKRVSIILLGGIAFMLGHALLGLGHKPSVALVALLVLGAAYCTMLCFWACVPSLVNARRHSTAYGVLTSACNLSVTVISLIVAPMVTLDPSYRVAGLFFAALGGIATFLAILLTALNDRLRLGLDYGVAVIRQSPLLTLTTMTMSMPITGTEEGGRESPAPDSDYGGEGSEETFLAVTVLPDQLGSSNARQQQQNHPHRGGDNATTAEGEMPGPGAAPTIIGSEMLAGSVEQVAGHPRRPPPRHHCGTVLEMQERCL